MTEILTEAECCRQVEESLETITVAEPADGFDLVQRDRDCFSQNYFWEVQLRPGLRLSFNDQDYHTSLNLKGYHDESVALLISKFYLSGIHRVLTPGIKGIEADYQEKAGQNYLFSLPDLTEVEMYPAGQRFQFFVIDMELEFLQSLGTGLESLPAKLCQLMQGDEIERFHQPLGRNTRAMQLALQQILHCPYHGLTKRMYLEGKVLELLSLQLARWVEDEQRSHQLQMQQASDLERVHHAREILLRDLINPPSLLALARQVGLNDYKLKVGFRQVFGTTVFGYLHDYRMERAKQLLENQEISIAALAYAVGYASQSRFCDAFKRRFGVSPKTYQRLIR